VRIGDTSIVCGVRAEILPIHEIANYRAISPLTQQPLKSTSRGEDEDEDYTEITTNHLLIPNLELATGCFPTHIPGGPPSQEAQSLSQRLLSLLHTSKIVRTSDLKIYYNPSTDVVDQDEQQPVPQLKAFWTLYIDLLCISYGGSIFDAAWLALYAALKDTLLPKAWWDEDLGHVLCSLDLKEAQALKLRGCPVPLTFGVFVPEKRLRKQQDGGAERWILCGTDAFEEECCEEVGTITVDEHRDGLEIVKLEKNGGLVVGMSEIRELCQLARTRRHEWQGVVKGAAMGMP
jgi:exosome complex component RRP43